MKTGKPNESFLENKIVCTYSKLIFEISNFEYILLTNNLVQNNARFIIAIMQLNKFSKL